MKLFKKKNPEIEKLENEIKEWESKLKTIKEIPITNISQIVNIVYNDKFFPSDLVRLEIYTDVQNKIEELNRMLDFEKSKSKS